MRSYRTATGGKKVEECLCKLKEKSAILKFSLVFPPLPERRARPGSRDALQVRAEARLARLAERWLLQQRGGRRPGAGSRARATPSPVLLTMRPVSRRTLDWIYSVVGSGGGGTPQRRIPGPASREPTVCSRLGTPKPIPKLSVYALPSAPPLPGGHALPPLTSGLPGPGACGLCFRVPPVAGWQPGLSRESSQHTDLSFCLSSPLSVATCDRLALLGIRHLCIDCSCATTATEGVSRQILGNE